MAVIAVGKQVPEVALHLTGDRLVNLSDYRGKPLVLYFYPKASTPGCTTEAVEFTAALPDFKAAGNHYDPVKNEHGFDNAGGPHAGDMANVFVAEDGTARFQTLNARITLNGGAGSLFDDDGSAVTSI